MVVLSLCPTIWTAGAIHPCWDKPNRVRAEGRTFRFMGWYSPLSPTPAKSLAPHAPEGYGAPCFGTRTRAAVLDVRRTLHLDPSRRATTPAIVFAVCGGGGFQGKPRQIVQRLHCIKQSEGTQMVHRDVIAKIARRLPHRTQRDVAEVVEILTEVWTEELVNGKEIMVPDIGRLSIEVQDMRAGGVLGKHGRLRRVYGRFRPTPKLKEQMEVEFE